MRVEKESIRGGYVRVEIGGAMHRVYYEEAGEGEPLLCLHTAGSDGRQYRGVLQSKRITDRYRVVCFDMPFHGKSSPPPGWQNSDYKLSSERYIEMIGVMIDALDLGRPITMGCSIGGRVVLQLALQMPHRFKALIGLESGAHVEPIFPLEWLHHPNVHGGEVCAAAVSGLLGPAATDEDRWETIWHYMQSGPGVFKGDLHFYNKDGDLRGSVGKIDTSKCPLYLLSGEYDYSCTPEDGMEVASLVAGSKFQLMKGLGHFPMSEAPELFVDYLMPVLEDIDAR